MPAEIVKVVAETPASFHGDTTEKPTPTPNANSTSVSAAVTAAPANTADQLIVDRVSSTATVGEIVSVIMMPSLREAE
jgi:hypothetical protein